MHDFIEKLSWPNYSRMNIIKVNVRFDSCSVNHKLLSMAILWHQKADTLWWHEQHEQ